jgi:hypothetical protein
MQPPTIARWLLKHFGCSANNEAVIGDLDERYRGGRSVVWYWLQVSVAIATSFGTELIHHKLRSVRAILIGWAVFIPGIILFRSLLILTANWFHAGVDYDLVLIMRYAVWGLGWMSIGWVMRRVHRPTERAMILAFVATVLIVTASLIPLFTMKTAPGAGLYVLLVGLIATLIGLLGILFGAGFFSHSHAAPSDPVRRIGIAGGA